jgi:hypothetical protein
VEFCKKGNYSANGWQKAVVMHPVGVFKSPQHFNSDSGVGLHVKKRAIKRGICPEFKQNLGG